MKINEMKALKTNRLKTIRSMALWMAASGLTLGATGWCGAQGTPSTGQGSQNTGSSAGQLPVDTGSGLSSNGVTPGSTRNGTTGRTPSLGIDEATGNPGRFSEQQMENTRNAERQRKLVEDTEKLVALVTQLKVEVDKSNKDTLSLDVVRKADEIEKLAKSVKEKMKRT
jgi:hypothetical protein